MEDLVLRLPAFLVDPLAFLLTIAVTVDAVRSFQAAMDLREVSPASRRRTRTCAALPSGWR